MAEQGHDQTDEEHAQERRLARHERIRIFGDFPQSQAEHRAQAGEERILDRRDGQYAVEGQDGHGGRDEQNRPQRHALLQEAAAPREHGGQAEKLKDAVRCRAAGRAAEEHRADLIEYAGQHGMENRVRGQIFAGHILYDFALEIIVDDAGEEGQQRRRIGERKDQKIERNRQAAAAGRIIPRRRGEEVGKQRAQQRGHQAGNGKAADEAARAGQKAVVNHQLAAQPEEKREDQRQKAAVFQRARRMLFKRRAGGISRREQ